MHVEFLALGVVVTVASRDARNVPTIAHGIGRRVAPDGRQVTVFLAASRSQALLDAVRETGAIAASFCEATTHRALQLKGTDAAVVPVEPDDHECLAAYLRLLDVEFQRVKDPEGLAKALVDHAPADLAAVRFTPTAAFVQTPGAGAGAPIKL